MNNGWYFNKVVLTSNFQQLDFGAKARHMKLKVIGGNVEFGVTSGESDGELVDADGMQTFHDVNRSGISVKGTGTITVIAWDGE